MTFDQVQEAFRARVTPKTAADYLDLAIEYFKDDMIGDETFIASVEEIAAALKQKYRR